jgi:hypothetical protein
VDNLLTSSVMYSGAGWVGERLRGGSPDPYGLHSQTTVDFQTSSVARPSERWCADRPDNRRSYWSGEATVGLEVYWTKIVERKD